MQISLSKLRISRVILRAEFCMLLFLSLLFITGVIGAIVSRAIADANNVYQLLERSGPSSFYYVCIYMIIGGSFGKVLIVTITLVYRQVLPFSRLAQMAKIQFNHRFMVGAYYYSRRIMYHQFFVFPFFEWWAIKRDAINVINRLIKGEDIALPRYPVWYNPNDNPPYTFLKFIAYLKQKKILRRKKWSKVFRRLLFWRR